MKKGYFLLLALLLHLSVHATLPPITGTLAFCDGTTTTLSNATPGGTWSMSAMVAVINSTTGVAVGIVAGTATVSYTLGADVATAVMTVYPIASAITGSAAVCTGSTSTLSSASGGGAWSSSNPTMAAVGPTTGIVTGVSAGTAMISYTSTYGCSTTVVVTTYPAPSPITGPTSFCAGSTTTLSSTPVGGTWVGSNPAIAMAGFSSGIVIGYAAGTTTISYVLPSSCFTSTTVTVNIAPSITGISTVCTGLTTTLNDYSGTGTWSGGSPSIATINSAGVVTGIAAGSTTISRTNAFCTTTQVIDVINSIPAITGPTYLCTGTSATLSNSISGGAWSSSAGSVAPVGTSSGILSGLTTGTATISYSLGTCGIVTTNINVFATPPAITGPTSLCQGTTATFSNSVSGGTWSSTGTALTIDVSSGVATGVGAAITQITYTLPTGCKTVKWDTVHPSPAVSGPTSVCVGGTINLATDYGLSLTNSAPAVASLTAVGMYSFSVTGLSLGTTLVTFTDGRGCKTARTITATSTCTGTPTGGTATAPTYYMGIPVPISLSGATVDCGISYQWQSSPDNTTWTNIGGATNATYSNAPSTATWYRCVLTCASTSLSGTSSSILLAPTVTIGSHTTIAPPDTSCSASHFYISALGLSSTLSVTTYFGDGLSSSQVMTLGGGVYNAHIYHYYTLPGTYSVKQVLFNGTMAIDSVTFSYEYHYCHSLPIRLYVDNNSNCSFDTSDVLNLASVTVRIDSNGTPIDTISCTSGFYYKALGSAGTVYGFHVLSVGGGLSVSCPSGDIYDTIVSYVNTYVPKYFGLICSAGGQDLSVSTSVQAGRHSHRTTILVTNANCTTTTPTVTLTNYRYTYPSPYWPTTPPPTSVSGNTVSWTLAPMAAGETRTIVVGLERTTWLLAGDTTASIISVSPVTGDINPSNNTVTRNDTVRTSFDPNDIAVSPQGYTLPCTQLHYTVRFENDGNDTARNIYVLDTLPAHVDPSSLIVEDASAPMYVSIINDGIRNIAKFDFPDINLPDSSHHGLCNGIFHFNVKVRSAAPDGASIMNRVGIYFDDNEVVMTNQVNNPVGVPAITGASTICAATLTTLSNAFPGGTWSSSSATATVVDGVVAGVYPGSATISYTVANSCTSRTVTKNMTVDGAPASATITGTSIFCTGTTTTLSPSIPGGSWSSSNAAIATITGPGMVLGTSYGTATISYTTTNICGSGTVLRNVTVSPLPTAGSITGTSTVCTGSTSTLGATATGGTWSASNTNASVSGGVVTGNTPGTVTISYIVGNACGTAVATKLVSVNTAPSGSITGATNVCVAGSTTLTGPLTGGSWSASNTNVSVSSAGVVTGSTAGTVTVSYSIIAACGSATVTHIMTVDPLPVAGSLSGSTSVCVSGTTALTPSLTGGVWSASNANASVSAGTITGMAAGTVTISYTITNGCGSASATYLVTVNALPVAGTITGSSTVCESASISLTGTASGGVWTASNTNAIVTGGSVSGVTAGSVVISYAVTTPCGTATAIHSMTVDPLPVAGTLAGMTTLCEGITTAFTPTVPGGTWSAGGSSISVSGGSVTALSAGTAIVSYGITNACGTAFATLPLTVNPLPDAGTVTAPSTVCIGATITATTTATGGTWISKHGTTSIAGNIVTGLTSGSDELLYIVSNSCGADTAMVSITVDPCINGVVTVTKPGVEVFPNPASDKLLINTYGLRYDHYSIINNLGQAVAEHILDGNETTIIISSLTPGVYNIRLSGEDGSITRKFVHIE